jgi:TetR/AcrR family transcriptional regulator
MSEQEKKTEQVILDAAKRVFFRKGYAGARMQEIADEAKINKAMLHYYFRSKEKLFERIFLKSFQSVFPMIINIFVSEEPFEKKVENFFELYIDFLLDNPYLPGFVLYELSHNPDKLSKLFEEHMPLGRLEVFKNIFQLPEGYIQGLDPRQLFTNLLSWAVFPLVARPILTEVYQMEKDEYFEFINERKTLLPKLFLNSIRDK